MVKKDLNMTIEELYHLQNCKLAMGEYYQQLAEWFPGERLFWEEAISDEVNHARLVGRLIAQISSNPLVFKPGKFRVAVLETFLSGIYEQIDQLRMNALQPAQMLKIAYDYEISAIMSRPYEVVEPLDKESRDVRDRFAEEADIHGGRLKQYLAQKLGFQHKTTHIRLSDLSATSTHHAAIKHST